MAGVDYAIAVDGYSGDSGVIILTLAPPARPPNDNFANRIVLMGASIITNGTNADATKEPDEPDHAGVPGGKSAWWTWTPPFPGNVTLTTLGSDFDTVLAVFRGEFPLDLVEVASNDQDPLGGDTSRVTFAATTGAAYEIAVDGWNGESGHVVLALRLTPFPPRLTIFGLADGGSSQLKVSGTSGLRCVIEANAGFDATNTWTALATNLLGPDGAWAFADLAATNFPRRFYRAGYSE